MKRARYGQKLGVCSSPVEAAGARPPNSALSVFIPFSEESEQRISTKRLRIVVSRIWRVVVSEETVVFEKSRRQSYSSIVVRLQQQPNLMEWEDMLCWRSIWWIVKCGGLDTIVLRTNRICGKSATMNIDIEVYAIFLRIKWRMVFDFDTYFTFENVE